MDRLAGKKPTQPIRGRNRLAKGIPQQVIQAPVVAGGMSREIRPQSVQQPTKQIKPEQKKSTLQKAADFSERFLLRPWAGNAANFLITSGQNIGEAAALADPLVRKYADTATGASGQTRVRDVAALAGKSALDLSSFATGGTGAALGATARTAKTTGIGRAMLQGAKVGGAYGSAAGATQALAGQQPLLSRESGKQVLTSGAIGAASGAALAGVLGRLSKIAAKKAANRKIAQPAKPTPQPQVADDANPLLTEARKYKSAEEFANTQGETVYHGSTAQGLSELKPSTIKGRAGENQLPGIYVTDNYGFARDFSKKNGIQINEPIQAQLRGKVLEVKNVAELKTKFNTTDLAKIAESAKQQGYDAIRYTGNTLGGTGKETIVLNPDALKTKSQLTSIWEEANKGQQVINSGGRTTAKQNKQLQSVIENLRKGKDAQPIRERGFITTVRQSKNTPQGVKDIIRGSYIPRSNASLTEDARALVGTDPVAAEALALNPRNAVDIEVGNQLMAHYSAIGNHQKVAEIGEAMATSGTELGQAIQAFSKYDNTTPQGAIRFAQAAIQKHNSLGKNVIKMSDEQIKHIYDAAAAIQELPMGRERNIATQQLMDEVNDLIPSTVGDKIITVWKAGLLTSLRTHERNILGNTIMSVSERAKDIPAVGADILMSKKTGVRTVTATNQGTISGAKKGWQAAIDVVRTGYDPEQAINKYDVRHVTWGNNPVEQGLKKYTDAVFRTLGAEDKVFWNSAYARSLYDQAGAEAINVGQRGNKAFIEKLVQSPNEQMMLNATLDANVATFKDKNVLSGVINQAKQAMSKNEWSKVGGEILAPFTGVPSSVLGKFIDYSPIGFANGVRHAGKVMTGKVPTLQRQAAQEIGRGVIGSGLFGLGAYLASKGLLTGQAKDAKEARQWELEGKKANSILIGGEWRSLQSVGPQTLILLAGAKAQETLGDKGGLVTYGSQIGKDFLGQSFLAGVQGPLNAITDPTRYGMSYAKSQVSSFVPNIVKDTAKAFDPLQRETNTVTDAIKGSIPGVRNTLTPKRDVLGNVMSNDTSGIQAYIDVLGSSKKKSSPIIDELSRLNDAGFNATPSKILPTLSSGSGKRKVKIKLTPAELNTLEGKISSELQAKLNREVQSAHYKNMTDEDKAKKIQDVVEKVRAEYKKKAVRSYNQSSKTTTR